MAAKADDRDSSITPSSPTPRECKSGASGPRAPELFNPRSQPAHGELDAVAGSTRRLDLGHVAAWETISLKNERASW